MHAVAVDDEEDPARGAAPRRRRNSRNIGWVKFVRKVMNCDSPRLPMAEMTLHLKRLPVGMATGVFRGLKLLPAASSLRALVRRPTGSRRPRPWPAGEWPGTRA